MSSKRDRSWLAVALKAARNSTCRRAQHGCVIVRHSSVLAVAWNSYRNYDCEGVSKEHLSHHAEVAAIRKVKQDLNGTTLYVARQGNRMSKPCRDCEKVILSVGIKRVVWTVDEVCS